MTQAQTSLRPRSRAARERRTALQVTVLLPAYNEEQAIASVLEEVCTVMEVAGHAHEILVVDDASSDRTAEIVESFAALRWDSPVRLIRRPTNGGAGAARKTGLRVARGDVVVMLDADGSYPASAIPELLRYFPAYDQVNGARTSEQGSCRWLRRPAKWLIRMLACYLTGTKIPDLNTGLKALRRDVIRRFLWVVPDGFSCVTTMTLAFLANGYHVKYVPVSYRRRIGKSKFRPLKDTANYLATVLRIVLYFRPLRVFVPLAALITVLGMLKGVWSFRSTGSLQESDVIVITAGFLTAMVGLLADIIVAHHRR